MKSFRRKKFFLQAIGLISVSLIFASQFALAAIEPRIVGGVESNPDERDFMMHIKIMIPRSQGDTTSLVLLSRDGSVDTGYEGALISQGEALEFAGPDKGPFAGQLEGAFAGQLVDCGLGEGPCDKVSGKVCVIQEGGNALSAKIKNCEAGKGLAAIIYDDQSSGINAAGVQRTNIPVIGVRHQDGLALLDALGKTIVGDIVDLAGCGGTLIQSDWVVTAAHCLSDVKKDSIERYPSESFKLIQGGHEIPRAVKSVIVDKNELSIKRALIHRGFSIDQDGLLQNDIALIELASAAAVEKPLDIIDSALLSAAIDLEENVLVIGRGTQKPVKPSEEDDNKSSGKLFEVELPLAAIEVCEEKVGQLTQNDSSSISRLSPAPDLRLNAGHLCMGGTPQGGIGGCHGDSGGPIVLQNGDGTFSLAGLVSQGIGGCAQPEIPEIHTRVPAYAQAIDNVISGKTNEFKGEPVEETAVLDESGSTGGGGGGANNVFLMGVLILASRRRFRLRAI